MRGKGKFKKIINKNDKNRNKRKKKNTEISWTKRGKKTQHKKK